MRPRRDVTDSTPLIMKKRRWNLIRSNLRRGKFQGEAEWGSPPARRVKDRNDHLCASSFIWGWLFSGLSSRNLRTEGEHSEWFSLTSKIQSRAAKLLHSHNNTRGSNYSKPSSFFRTSIDTKKPQGRNSTAYTGSHKLTSSLHNEIISRVYNKPCGRILYRFFNDKRWESISYISNQNLKPIRDSLRSYKRINL